VGVVLTPDEYTEALDAIGWSPHRLAQRLGVHETRTRRWGTGAYPVPENVAKWLRHLARVHEVHRLPAGWKEVTHAN
jgi:ribosome-binding protein aMBF1 (putative translation factor)